jgi:two-component system, LytTR family, response regulator
MIRAIIVDDEPPAIRSLEVQLKKAGKILVVAACENIVAGREAIETQKPDLLFLDVELSDNTGFELLESVSGRPIDVIFTTAYEQYALQAIKASALDYLMKPIKFEELTIAINKHLDRRGNNPVMKQVEVLLEHYQRSTAVKNLALPTQDGIEFVSIEDIVRLESESNYTLFYLNTGRKIVISKTLKDYESILSSSGFFRVHNSHIVNLRYLDKYFRGDGGYVRMKDGSTADVSRLRKEEFLKALSNI